MVARVDLLGPTTEQMGYLLHEDVTDKVGEVGLVESAGLDRAAVDDDAGGHAGIAREVPAERDAAVLPRGRRRGWDLLDGELGAIELARPRVLEPFHRIEDVVVEPLGACAVGGQGGGNDRPA